MRKILMALLTLIVLPTLLLQNFAVDAYASQVEQEKGKLIYSNSYYDEETNSYVSEKVFFIGQDLPTRAASGEGTYRNEKTHTWAGGTVTTYYAQGYFVWGNGTVSVSNATGGRYNVPEGSTVTNVSLTSGKGKYLGIFNEYAYVTYSFHVTTKHYAEQDLSVTIRVSQSGNNI